MRLALAVDESRAYWAQVDPTVPAAHRAAIAFEQHWFGAKSAYRVRNLLANFAFRYDAYPEALAVLRRWKDMDPETRQLVCHWHLQLADPLYRAFTGHFLVQRREGPRATVTRDVVVRWIRETYGERWAITSCVQFASKLLSAAYEAGLVTKNRDPRPLAYPRLTEPALAYVLRLLKHVEHEGSLLDNPYLASVGATGGFLHDRLRALPGLSFRRMGELTELDWTTPDLRTWAEATL